MTLLCPQHMDVQPITIALERAGRGEPGASEDLWELVYSDLRRMAAGRLARLRPGETLQATALVHEAWMRLQANQSHEWNGRAHFFGAAARSMRNILVDQMRSKQRLRRNGGQRAVDFELDAVAQPDQGGVDEFDLVALDDALTAMGELFERPTRIVMLRYFVGLTIPEIADLLGIAARTVDRDFLFARTWLRRQMEQG
jgi:RNA polymerase sigma factor (TIGR02999 family)